MWGPVSTSPPGPNWVGARSATSNMGSSFPPRSGASPWIRRSPRVTRFVLDSDYCVKLFATRAIKPVANRCIISRINVLFDQQVKRNNSISISWTPAHTNSDDPLAQGNAEEDRLAARGCVALHLMTQRRPSAPASRNLLTVLPRPTRPPLRRWSSATPRGRLRNRNPPGGTHVYHPLTHACPCSGAPFPVAFLNAFVLILGLLSLFMTIMGTLLVTNFPFPGVALSFPSTRSRDSSFGI